MTTGASWDSERFAAAVERDRQYAGTASSGDALLDRELDLVALLRESRASLAPGDDASARMRARVMAAAATMMPAPAAEHSAPVSAPAATAMFSGASATGASAAAEPAQDETNVVSIGSARGRHRFPTGWLPPRPPTRGSALGVSAAAALVLLAVTGGGALFSKDALPGDTLYGVKQTTESGLVALTPGGNKAQRQLDVAATRIDEVQKLNSGDAAPADRGADISQALRGFNEQTPAASRAWLAGPGASDPGHLSDWASTQSQRLSSMRSSMPSSAQPDAESSMNMLDQVRTRANTLNSRSGCDSVTTGQSDEFGPIPAKGACSSRDSGAQTRPVLPGAPAGDRSNAPSLNNEQRATSGSGTGQLPVTGGSAPGTTPDLDLPGLPQNGPSTDGILPNRETTSNTPEQPGLGGLRLPLLGN